MKNEHPADELTRNQFLTFVYEIYGILKTDDSKESSAKFKEAKSYFMKFAEAVLKRLESKTFVEQATFISKLKRDCFADIPLEQAIRKAGIKNDFTGNELNKLYIWMIKYREFVSNLAPDPDMLLKKTGILTDLKLRSFLWEVQQAFGPLPAPKQKSKEVMVPEESQSADVVDDSRLALNEADSSDKWTDATKALFIHFLLIQLNPELPEVKKIEVLSKLTGKPAKNLKQYFGSTLFTTKSHNWRTEELKVVRSMFETLGVSAEDVQNQLNTINSPRK